MFSERHRAESPIFQGWRVRADIWSRVLNALSRQSTSEWRWAVGWRFAQAPPQGPDRVLLV